MPRKGVAGARRRRLILEERWRLRIATRGRDNTHDRRGKKKIIWEGIHFLVAHLYTSVKSNLWKKGKRKKKKKKKLAAESLAVFTIIPDGPLLQFSYLQWVCSCPSLDLLPPPMSSKQRYEPCTGEQNPRTSYSLERWGMSWARGLSVRPACQMRAEM